MNIRAWLELCRLSNAPTIITNVLVGIAAGLTVDAGPWPIAPTILVCVAMLLMYIGGMALNDVVDHRIDNQERPTRPIPSGRIARGQALLFAQLAIASGVAITAAVSWWACGLAAGLAVVIVSYNLIHARWRGAVVLMAMCRMLVYLIAYAAVAEPIIDAVLLPTVAAGVYIVLLSVVAAGEVEGTASRLWSTTLFLAVIPLAAALPLADPVNWLAWLTGGVFLLWILTSARWARATPSQTPRTIMAWLAGICLMDAYFLAALDQPVIVIIAAVCFSVTTLAHRRIAGS